MYSIAKKLTLSKFKKVVVVLSFLIFQLIYKHILYRVYVLFCIDIKNNLSNYFPVITGKLVAPSSSLRSRPRFFIQRTHYVRVCV